MKKTLKFLLSTMLLTSVMLMGCNGNSNEVATPTTEKEVVTTTTTKAPVESTNSTTASTENKETTTPVEQVTTTAKEQETTTAKEQETTTAKEQETTTVVEQETTTTTVTENETTTSATEKETTTVTEQETTTTTPVQEETTTTKPVEAETTTQNIQPVVSSDGRTYFDGFSIILDSSVQEVEAGEHYRSYIAKESFTEGWNDKFYIDIVPTELTSLSDVENTILSKYGDTVMSVSNIGPYECLNVMRFPQIEYGKDSTMWCNSYSFIIYKDSIIYVMSYYEDSFCLAPFNFMNMFKSFRFTGDESLTEADYKPSENPTEKPDTIQYVDSNGYLLPEYIEYDAADDTDFANGVRIRGIKVKNLKEIKLPSTINGYTVTTLCGAYNNCTETTTIIVPDTVESIYGSTFYNCTSLVNLTLPEGLEMVGMGEFENCTSLKSITFPSTVINYGINQFKGCTSLESVTLLNRTGDYAPRNEWPTIDPWKFSAAPNKITIYGYRYSLEADYNTSNIYVQLAQHPDALDGYNYVASWMDEGLFQNPMAQ